MAHLFITFAILMENYYTPKHLNCSPEEIMTSKGREVEQQIVSLPPPYDPPPSYVVAMNQSDNVLYGMIIDVQA